ncbi:MAG: hypothetical protein Crog4KO_24650 [Crocinitomicaceae bacterium]
MAKKSILGILLLVAVLFSCKKEGAPLFHREYFGLETGRYVIYNVTEITHDTALNPAHDTVTYQLKTVWEAEYIDNQGRSASEFRRYKRSTDTDPWVLSDIWTGIHDGVRAELIEENQRVVKLVFAPTLSKDWDINAYNTMTEMDAYYSDVHVDTTINGVLFDSTVVVDQEDYSSLIDTVRMFEVYAKHVGLIRKYSKNNLYNFADAEPQEGREVYYEYVEHGFE